MPGCNPNACYPNNGYPNNGYSNNCYSPSNSSCYPNNPYLCAPPQQPVNQTCFRKCDDMVVNLSGLAQVDPEGSCTIARNIEINGSGLSIVSVCTLGADPIGANDSFTSAVAGTICSCPNTFTATVKIQSLPLQDDTGLGSTLTSYATAVGNVTFTVCGGTVIGQGTITGSVLTEDSQAPGPSESLTGNVCITGCVCNSCGTRNINFNNICITAHRKPLA